MSDHDFYQQAKSHLEVEPSRAALIQFASWLDKTWVKDGHPYPVSPHLLSIAQAVECLGLFRETLGENPDTIKRTMAAAQRYRTSPSEQSYRAYIQAASNSYPFGPGEGSHHIYDLGFETCQPGCGCRSGAGCLVDNSIDCAAFMAYLQQEFSES